MAESVEQGQQLRFTVLGPVDIRRGEERLQAGSPQQRALLATLLLRDGKTMTAPELVDALWGEDPPQSATAALRTYASRLRRALGPDADMLVSESGGYALRTHRAALDLEDAERWAAEAEQARRLGEVVRSRELAGRALAQWTGEALAGAPGPYCRTQRARLEERRLTLLEARIDLDLQLGRQAEVVAELTALTAAHPLREGLRGLLMLALHRCGRQAEALAVYADTRRLLADELGVDPRPELTELHRRVQSADAALAAPIRRQRDADTPGVVPVTPAQLPAAVSDFTGHAAEVKELAEQLAQAQDGRGMQLAAVSGVGGVGKTALAVHVAQAARKQFPDGQLYVDLQGAGPDPADPAAVLGAFLRALGVADSAIPHGRQARIALYRSTLGGRRVLVLLDNARDAAQITPLLPVADGCAALVTSRTRMTALDGAYVIDLEVMSPQEALTLFARIAPGADEAAIEVVETCGFLPLALRIAASRLSARRSWTAGDLARKLADERRRLDELKVGDLAVTATFELSYGQLPPDQARAFRLLALAHGPDISLEAAAAVLDLDAEPARRLLQTLVDASLLETPAPGRYRYHDLVRLYARACAERDEPCDARDAAMSRLLDFYLATTGTVCSLERPGDPLTQYTAPTQYPGLTFEDQDAAQQWLRAEAIALLACAGASTDRGALRRAVDLLLVARDLCESGAYTCELEDVDVQLLTAVQAAGDLRAEGRLRFIMARILIMGGRFNEAVPQAEAAVELSSRCGDTVLHSFALDVSGIIAGVRLRLQDSEAYLTRALEAFRSYGNRSSEACALSTLARIFLETGRVDEALETAEQALLMFQDLGTTRGVANGRFVYGLALARAGRPDDALREMEQAVTVFRDRRLRPWEAEVYYHMAEVHFAAGRVVCAAGLAEQALAAAPAAVNEWTRAHVLTMLGQTLLHTGHLDRARVCWHEALDIHERLSSPETTEIRELLASLDPPGA